MSTNSVLGSLIRCKARIETDGYSHAAEIRSQMGGRIAETNTKTFWYSMEWQPEEILKDVKGIRLCDQY